MFLKVDFKYQTWNETCILLILMAITNWDLSVTTEETNAKTALIEDGLPRQAVGPSYPSEGAPGGKYQLLPQHDNIS